ncbi:MAG: MGMT family protein [Anaerolineales bacterium]|nr:MGMT family protein [Anaerolineales bacterium]
MMRILLPNEERLAEAVPFQAPPAAISQLSEDLRRFLEGEPITFTLDLLALESCSPFQQSVLVAESRVPRGCVTTYGKIAAHLGAPLAARAVGGALARNPFPIIIPCHRAIRSDRHLGGFRGGLAMKRQLLALEGVPISNDGRVLVERLHYA